MLTISINKPLQNLFSKISTLNYDFISKLYKFGVFYFFNHHFMKKLLTLTALVCSATFAKAQYTTFRIMDNTGYAGGITTQIMGDRFPGRPCFFDNITEPPASISTSTYSVFTPGTSTWSAPGATGFNGLIVRKLDAMGMVELTSPSPLPLCSVPPTGLSIMTNFNATMDPITITITPVGTTQLDIVLTP
jgi:hypothetical protein